LTMDIFVVGLNLTDNTSIRVGFEYHSVIDSAGQDVFDVVLFSKFVHRGEKSVICGVSICGTPALKKQVADLAFLPSQYSVYKSRPIYQ